METTTLRVHKSTQSRLKKISAAEHISITELVDNSWMSMRGLFGKGLKRNQWHFSAMKRQRRGRPLKMFQETALKYEKAPKRGEIWFVDFSPSIGSKIQDPHPALVVSVDELNKSPWGLIVVCPITT